MDKLKILGALALSPAVATPAVTRAGCPKLGGQEAGHPCPFSVQTTLMR